MASLHQAHAQCSLSIEVTFYQMADGYWVFAHQFPVHARGETFQDCMETLCTALQALLTAGEQAVHCAVLATADALIVVDNPYTTPVCAVELFDPDWPHQRRLTPTARHGR